MRSLKSCKKGSFFDNIGIMIAALLMIVIFVAIGIAYKATGGALEASKGIIDVPSYNESADIVATQADRYPVFWDFLIVFIIFGFWLASFIAAWILGNNPIFMTIYFIMSLAGLVVGFIFQFALKSFMESTAMLVYTIDYPITYFVVTHFLVFSVFFIISIGAALFAKRGEDY